jgi:hypothetical protein
VLSAAHDASCAILVRVKKSPSASRDTLDRMSIAKQRACCALTAAGGFGLVWISNGPAAAGMTIAGVALFVALPFWLAYVLGKPHSRTCAPRSRG